MVSELVELSGSVVRQQKKKFIFPRHIYLGIDEDDEMRRYLGSGVILPTVGRKVVPYTSYLDKRSTCTRSWKSMSRNESPRRTSWLLTRISGTSWAIRKFQTSRSWKTKEVTTILIEEQKYIYQPTQRFYYICDSMLKRDSVFAFIFCFFSIASFLCSVVLLFSFFLFTFFGRCILLFRTFWFRILLWDSLFFRFLLFWLLFIFLEIDALWL